MEDLINYDNFGHPAETYILYNSQYLENLMYLISIYVFSFVIVSIIISVFSFVIVSIIISFILLCRKYSKDYDENADIYEDEDIYEDSDSDNGTNSDDEFMVVGLVGKKYAGKDTVADYLVDNYGFVKLAFAEPLKQACETVFGFSHEQLYDPQFKEVIDQYWGHSPREILQIVGTELFRNELPKHLTKFSNDVWVRSIGRKIANMRQDGYTRFVITDTRFPNEYDFVNNYKFAGKCWKIIRPSLNDQTSTTTHESELFAENAVCDTVLYNSGTLNELYEYVDRIMENHDNSE